jgi:hypothetical protein
VGLGKLTDAITGSPSVAGNSTFTLTMTDGSGQSAFLS